jgi:hypothetical protein
MIDEYLKNWQTPKKMKAILKRTPFDNYSVRNLC